MSQLADARTEALNLGTERHDLYSVQRQEIYVASWISPHIAEYC